MDEARAAMAAARARAAKAVSAPRGVDAAVLPKPGVARGRMINWDYARGADSETVANSFPIQPELKFMFPFDSTLSGTA